MPLIEMNGRKPSIAGGVYVSPSSYIIGDVRIGEEAIIMFGAVLRGDLNTIEIGGETSIQDNVIIHPTPRFKTIIGSRVVVGHGAIIEGATINDETMIGIGAIVLDGVKIGKNCMIGAGAVVREATVIPDNSIAVGVPARVIGQIRGKHLEVIKRAVNHYRILREIYLKGTMLY